MTAEPGRAFGDTKYLEISLTAESLAGRWPGSAGEYDDSLDLADPSISG